MRSISTATFSNTTHYRLLALLLKHLRVSIRRFYLPHDIAPAGWPTLSQRSGALSVSVATTTFRDLANLTDAAP